MGTPGVRPAAAALASCGGTDWRTMILVARQTFFATSPRAAVSGAMLSRLSPETAGVVAADHAPADRESAETGPGVAELAARFASGHIDQAEIGALIEAYPSERDAMIAMLHQHVGNAAVTETLAPRPPA